MPDDTPRKPLSASPTELVALLRSQLAEGRTVRLRAEGHSMMPLIRPGDTLIIRATSAKKVHCGQVLVLASTQQDKLVIHRLRCKKAGQLQTQGDNASQPDGLFRDGNLLGVVNYLERQERRISCGFGREGVIIGWAAQNRVARSGWRFIRRALSLAIREPRP